MIPNKTIKDERLAYLVNLESICKSMGYQTKLDLANGRLELYSKGEIEDTEKEIWID